MHNLTSTLALFAALLGSCHRDEPAAPAPVAPTSSATPAAATPAPSGSAAGVDETALRLRQLVAAADRSDADRALDAGRHPAELLGFYGVLPGMRVAEIVAGTGYTAELLARAVGDKGQVFAQNPRWVLEKFAEAPWSARLKTPAMAHVVRVDREIDDPLPPEAKNLDVVLMVLVYHDTVWAKVDRPKMLKAIFAALKPGGTLGVVDHSAREGTALADVETLHRIEEKVVRSEVEAAGFRFVAAADFLRNASDARDWNDSPKAAADRRGTSDRFVLKFARPE